MFVPPSIAHVIDINPVVEIYYKATDHRVIATEEEPEPPTPPTPPTPPDPPIPPEPTSGICDGVCWDCPKPEPVYINPQPKNFGVDCNGNDIISYEYIGVKQTTPVVTKCRRHREVKINSWDYVPNTRKYAVKIRKNGVTTYSKSNKDYGWVSVF